MIMRNQQGFQHYHKYSSIILRETFLSINLLLTAQQFLPQINDQQDFEIHVWALKEKKVKLIKSVSGGNKSIANGFNILLNLQMIDRALGFTAHESYYFQLYPVNLILLQQPVPSPESKFKFSIYKGMQKFDQNKIMTDSNFIDSNGTHIMPFRGCQLNFYVPNFNVNRKSTFTLKLNQKQANQEYDLGGIDIDPATYIAEFKEKGQNRFQQRVQISDQYAIEFEIYLQKSRFALQKIVKSFKNERTLKSPVRERKSPVQERRSPVDEVKSPVSDSRTPVQQRKTSRVQQRASQPVEEPAIEKSASKNKSRIAEKSPAKEQKVEQVKEETIERLSEKKPQRAEESRSKAKKQTSVKSQQLVSPLVKSKQMKRTSGRNETTIRSSQRLVKEEETTDKPVHADSDSWTNHLKLVAFTIVGMVLIYIVMHPNSKV